MATPLWCWLAVVLRLYAPSALGSLAGNTLFAAACILLWPNVEAGIASGRTSAARALAFTQDIKAGLPPYQLIARHTPAIYPSQDELAVIIPMMRKGGVGPFRGIRDNPPFHEVPILTAPSSLSLARWDDTKSTAHVTGVDPQLVYRLSSPHSVLGVRIRYSHANPEGAPARFQFTWLRPGQSQYVPSQRYAYWTLPTGADRQTTVWINDVISEFRIQPDNQPCEFHIERIELLEPGAPPSSGAL